MIHRWNIWALFVIIPLLMIAGCSEQVDPALSRNLGDVSQEQRVDGKVRETEEKIEDNLADEMDMLPRSYRLAFVGDIMIHEGQIKAAYLPQKDSYSFDGYFSEVKEYLQKADFAVGNLETTLSGRDKKYTGYPQFNAPEALAEELAEAGFDLMTTANNHSFDRRELGVVSTITYLDQWGIKHTGTYKTKDDAEEPEVIENKGLKTAFLAYTYGTNGIVVPKEKSFLVNRIDLPKIVEDIRKARDNGAEVIVVGLHFGTEYKREPGESEKILVNKIAEAGADLIIGTHPHVLQKVEKIQVEYQGKQKDVLVAYSLGNFVSGYISRFKDTGIILFVDLQKVADNNVEIKGFSYLPVWVHRYQEDKSRRYRVIPVEKGLNKFNQKDYSLSQADYHKLQQAWQDTKELLGEENLETINKESP